MPLRRSEEVLQQLVATARFLCRGFVNARNVPTA